jgi:hypothetical protein
LNKVYVPKPPRRNKKGIGQREKKSTFNYGLARDTIGLPGSAHHFQVYSAAVASADNIAADETPLVISPTKEEVKAEWAMLHTIATELEHKVESSKKKIDSLQSKSRTLTDSLKAEKSKSRTAMEQLLGVTTTQTN